MDRRRRAGVRLGHPPDLVHFLHDPVEIHREPAARLPARLDHDIHAVEQVRLARQHRPALMEQTDLARHAADVVRLVKSCGGFRRPSMKRVTRYPSGSMKDNTSGATPGSPAALLAAYSTSRMTPSRSVPSPVMRIMHALPPESTL